MQQDRDGTTLRRWSLSRAWPVKFVAGDWDNESDENVIESVTLTYDFFELSGHAEFGLTPATDARFGSLRSSPPNQPRRRRPDRAQEIR